MKSLVFRMRKHTLMGWRFLSPVPLYGKQNYYFRVQDRFSGFIYVTPFKKRMKNKILDLWSDHYITDNECINYVVYIWNKPKYSNYLGKWIFMKEITKIEKLPKKALRRLNAMFWQQGNGEMKSEYY